MKLAPLATLLLFSSCVSHKEPTLDYESVFVDEVMENMEEPEWAIDRMLKNDLHAHQDLPVMIDKILVETDRLFEINHPDHTFNDINETLKQALINMKNQISESPETINSNWKLVKRACRDCHHIYE